MARDIVMRLTPDASGLVPVDQLNAELLVDLLRVRGELKVTIKQNRTGPFHKKGMALFRVLFNLWEPARAEVDGIPVQKDFDSFRENLTIKAGYYTMVFGLDGSTFELKAKSLSWDAMDNVEFTSVFNHVIDVGLDMLGKADFLTPAQIEAAAYQLLGFSS